MSQEYDLLELRLEQLRPGTVGPVKWYGEMIIRDDADKIKRAIADYNNMALVCFSFPAFGITVQGYIKEARFLDLIQFEISAQGVVNEPGHNQGVERSQKVGGVPNRGCEGHDGPRCGAVAPAITPGG